MQQIWFLWKWDSPCESWVYCSSEVIVQCIYKSEISGSNLKFSRGKMYPNFYISPTLLFHNIVTHVLTLFYFRMVGTIFGEISATSRRFQGYIFKTQKSARKSRKRNQRPKSKISSTWWSTAKKIQNAKIRQSTKATIHYFG